MNLALLAAFEPPGTKDFVWPCWGPALNLGGVQICFNFVTFTVTLGFLAFVAFFYFGLRRPRTVPGKLQSLAEAAIGFVRENVGFPMLGQETDRWMPLLATLFFAIFFWNIFEVIPLVNFSPSSRIAFPLVMALVTWVTYNAVGIKRHGLGGYLKMVLFPPGAPLVMYILITPIEFISTIVIRPITLTLRLFANLLAGHFLLAVFFLGTVAMLQGGLIAAIAPVSFVLAIVLVGFEIFVSVLQAFIFSILTASYIGGAMAEEH